jgi:hypothetical protein
MWRTRTGTAFALCSGMLFIYLLFELNMLGKTHDYYLMPFLVPMFLLVSVGLQFFLTSKYSWYVPIALCAVPILAFLRINHRWNQDEPGYNKAFSLQQEQVRQVIPKNALCIIDNDESRYIALYFFKRKGFSLLPGEFSVNKLEALQLSGAEYLVCSNKNLDTSQFHHTHFQQLLKQELVIYKITSK